MKDVEGERQRSAAQTAQPTPPLSDDELVAIRAVAMQRVRQEAERIDEVQPETVGADGTYFFKAVRPGTYYIRATMPGYADPFALFPVEHFASDPTILTLIAKSAQTVTINGTESARMDLRIERGAAISGRVLYDDGAPAQQHWAVRARKQVKQGAPAAVLYDFVTDTDDLGSFRLSGLPVGEYILGVSYPESIVAHSVFTNVILPGRIAFVAFSGNTSFESKAQPITVTAGEERTGADITVPLHNLHRISGRVVAKSDSRPANYGGVELTTVDGTDFVASATLFTDRDGSFTLNFIPGNTTYTLKVRAAEIISTRGPDGGVVSQSLHDFAHISTKITLRDGDADNIVLEVPEPSATPEE